MQTSMLPPIGGQWHMLAYSVVAAAVAGYQAIQSIADPVFTQKGTNFQNPYNCGAFAAYAMSTHMLRARINTPSLRLRGFPVIEPFVGAAVVPTNANFLDMFDNPIFLRPDEDIEVDVDCGANADVVTVFIWLWMQNNSPIQINRNINGTDLRWVRFTATPTQVAGLWSGPSAITLDDQLEGGSYDVYGATLWGPTCEGFRLWFQNQYTKPGSLAFATGGNRLPYPWMESRVGLWGNFNTYSLPQVEIFGSGAGATTVTGTMLIAKSTQQFRGQNM